MLMASNQELQLDFDTRLMDGCGDDEESGIGHHHGENEGDAGHETWRKFSMIENDDDDGLMSYIRLS